MKEKYNKNYMIIIKKIKYIFLYLHFTRKEKMDKKENVFTRNKNYFK